MSLGFEWTLLVLGPNPPATTAFESQATQRRIRLDVVRHAAPELLALYESPLVLIRPDHIVAWRGHSDAPAQEVMDQVLGLGTPVRQ